MVHRMNTASLQEYLSKRYPDYAKMLEEGMSLEDSDRLLTERGLLSENDLLKAYADYLGAELLDEAVMRIPTPYPGIRTDYLKEHSLLPYQWAEDNLQLLAASPYSLDTYSYSLEQFFQKKVTFILARRSLIERLVTQIYSKVAESHIMEDQPADDETTLRQLAGEARIVRLVNEMFSQAIEKNASDIHVEPEETQLIIRFRIDGVLHEYLTLPLVDYPAIASRIKLIGNLNIAESRLPQDGRTNFQLGQYDIDIRISTIPIMRGESIVLRLLRKDSMRFDLRDLGMADETLKKFQRLIAIPHGIILVVGPTGSGKTTTLYSVMQQLNDHKRKIITIEDPVEYQLSGLSQMQTNPKIGLTFASGLRHIVRQDPDVILVGEIRDHETADIAINAALTGHLVLSTLHTNDAVGAITRLSDMGVENFLIASALYGVLSQRLVRKICLQCNGTGKGTHDNFCRNCEATGYKGRMGIYELLIVDDEIRNAIIKHCSSGEINRIALANGMIPLLTDGHNKVAAGITTEAEILRAATGAGN